MKRVFVAAAAMALTVANAAGLYDGAYAATSGGSFASVHSNGNQIVVAGLSAIPATNVTFTSLIGNVVPTQIAVWEVYGGSIVGDTATLSGQAIYNACNITMLIKFGPNSASSVVTQASRTPIGEKTNVDCAALTRFPATNFIKLL